VKAIKILLVVDDENDYILIQELLASGTNTNRYRLSWCTSYSDAINAMLKDRYALYLVDYKIGNYSGIHLLSEAVKSNCTKPIIILTGKGDKNIDEEALKAGAADCLEKDQINSEILERSIRYATKQFEILEKLRRSEHTFRVLFERSNDAIVISNASGQILDANYSALRFFEVEHSDIADINSAFFYLHPHERQAFMRILQRDGVVNDMLVELLTLNGDVRTCCVNSFIEIPQHGETELVYTFVKDVTEIHHQFLPSEILSQSYDLRDHLAQSVKAVRTSLSKINHAIENRLDMETCFQDQALFDTIRMNASFADQALQTLEEEHGRYQR
jgi:PAS domain S-box-containing protein